MSLKDRIAPERFRFLIDERQHTAGGMPYRVCDVIADRFIWFQTYGDAEAYLDLLHDLRLQDAGEHGAGFGYLDPEARPKPLKKRRKKAKEDPSPWMNGALAW